MNTSNFKVPTVFHKLVGRAERRRRPAETPLRAEVLSIDQLRQHAIAIAESHQVMHCRGRDRLIARLASNQKALLAAHALMTASVAGGRSLEPAGEWLIDNFYLIEEQIQTARRHFPKAYSQELPRLHGGPASGDLRIYHIALELISHVDGKIDSTSLSSFVAAYQSVHPLLLGELWGIPIVLRLALIENLRRVAERIADDRTDRDHANHWADRLLDVVEHDPLQTIFVTADMAHEHKSLTTAFVAEFSRRLQGQGSAFASPLSWIDHQLLAERGLTVDQAVQLESQQQASDQVSIGNSIGSLRFLNSMDWRDFVEELSVVEQSLRTDPAGVYPRMDFATRDRYRHVVEEVSKRTHCSQLQVAEKAIELTVARRATVMSTDRQSHVGFFLVDKGLPELELAVGASRAIGVEVGRWGRRWALPLYLGAILCLVSLITLLGMNVAATGGTRGWALGLMTLLLALSSSQLVLTLVNWVATLLVTPQPLPRMDYSEGVPVGERTLVAVPTMLTSAQGAAELLEAIELRYLANQDEHLHFAIVTDFPDASQETMPNDKPWLDLIREGIEALNRKYEPDRTDIFYLFHRPRRWNKHEQIWMGYERKRGKLADLNEFLLEPATSDAFSLIVGHLASLRGVRFVITLDTDTQLPRDAARELIATASHPLNRAIIDEASGLVCEGYGILQPRVATSLTSSGRSFFAKMCAGEPGLDPYTHLVSDVYQDLFRQGSFIGKGIYDLRVFERILAGRFPENLILSHDLLEGCHVRSGLVSDVQLIEDFPARYATDAARRHRWIRGDWQIIRWLLPYVPNAQGTRVRNSLSWLSRWKLFDNLRRSLVSPAMVVLLVLAWLSLPSPWVWTWSVTGIVFIPILVACLIELVRRPRELPLGLHLRPAIRNCSQRVGQGLLQLVVLSHEAIYCGDAVVRTIWRLAISRRRRLEWRTASDAEAGDRRDLAGSFRAMWLSPLIAVASSVGVWFFRPAAFSACLPFACAWFVAPFVVWWISRPLRRRSSPFDMRERLFLRRLARKTWHFFETFVGPDDNWLPPDNFQEHPIAAIAHRTSPTNIGLSLLSHLAANDFGYLSTGDFLHRTRETFRTLEKLERFRGHYYNWYDTRTLAPLFPRYVSSVDSGNLVAHLLTLRSGLAELVDQPILGPRQLAGLADTIRVFLELAESQPMGVVSSDARQVFTRLADSLESVSRNLYAARESLETVITEAVALVQSVGGNRYDPIQVWATAIERHARDSLADLEYLNPWLRVPSSAPASPVSRAESGELSGDSDDLHAALSAMEEGLTLRQLAQLPVILAPAIQEIGQPSPGAASANGQENARLVALRESVALAIERACGRMMAIEQLITQCSEHCDIEYEFLFDVSRDLLAIGYNVESNRRDDGFYDLLASEARLCSYVAIAQGGVPQSHWFALGRLVTTAGGETVLLSWSGSMFEYLMPLLVMPSHAESLLDQSCKAAVERQIAYASQRGVPWGVSESGYNVTDVHLNYQYQAFGVPGLGFKRGLADDLVIAPYASLMALLVTPKRACDNLQQLALAGYIGGYGFYEAIDFTPGRVAPGQSCAVVRSFMAHHQGMGLLSLAGVLLDSPMQRRFVANPILRATDLLLQERIPKAVPFYPRAAEVAGRPQPGDGREALTRIIVTPHTPEPEVQLLSNGRYHVMVTNAGSGYSRWNDLAITRWAEDIAQDDSGTFCYLRDLASGDLWSTAFQPTLKEASNYEARFTQARAEFWRRDFGLEVHTDISISPEDDIELRRVTITNRSRVERRIELTSYAEVVLSRPEADMAHPAFSKLFVQTEIDRDHEVLLCKRRPRSPNEKTPWLFHLMAAESDDVSPPSYETDRTVFLGRGNSVARPAAMSAEGPLSNSAGSVLDPIVSVRRSVVLQPDDSIRFDVVTGIVDSRENALLMADKYHDRHLGDRVFELAWTHGQVVLQQLNIRESDARLYARLSSSILFASPARRAAASLMLRDHRNQAGLWSYGISGDLPIVLLRIGDQARIDLVRQVVRAHAYWRSKGLAVDLVIWNEDHSGYRQELQDQIMALISAGADSHSIERPGGIFLRRAEQVPEPDRILFQAVARAIITDSGGSLSDQANRRLRVETPPAVFHATRESRGEPPARQLPSDQLRLFNGLGGFSADGREYWIRTSEAQRTPMPWVNVLANPYFGAVVSESGSCSTWRENAHEYRLTPWYNDPTTDRSGEVVYIRDDETGDAWSATPLPAGGSASYLTRHGFGYSTFECTQHGVNSELSIYVAIDAPVRFAVLKVRNESQRPRRLSVYNYVEWVLGELRSKSLLHVTTEVDAQTRAMFARNRFSAEFSDWIAFLDCSESVRSITGSRTEFLGRNGSIARPAALNCMHLTGKVGAGLDPCGAVQTQIVLEPGQERHVVFLLGAVRDVREAQALCQRFRGVHAARQALAAVHAFWKRTLGTLAVHTPDETLDLLSNGWLIYQVLACRIWGRCGYYQSGGAFGFRDQLQDVMALVHAVPAIARQHLLVAAERQFREGDVQHWWHPPTGRGVRTHFSDDLLWLPLATAHYVKSTGDVGVLDESLHFLEGRPCKPEEESYYDLPARSEERASLYDHCLRSIHHGFKLGAHGLPLIGCGDWNDGLNLVGPQGKGESVWLAFFLYEVLMSFAAIARQRGDTENADDLLERAGQLQQRVEVNGWDGRWYRRAYFDDGSPLGSAQNAECQIDSLPQSWAVLSGAGDRIRADMALNEVEARLVDRPNSLIRLFTPPFDVSTLEPGYIKGYVPGVRENGGQYTHAAIWVAMALAKMGSHRAWEYFELINPLRRGATRQAIATYKVEPYVVAADVYAVAPHVGRGGWTWYTGSAGWMYRLIIESLLGLKLEANRLYIEPLMPPDWDTFSADYGFHDTTYRIVVERSTVSSQPPTVVVDNVTQPDNSILLLDDRREHEVRVVLS